MWQNKRIISIIPARGGSTRLKNKNILPVGGIPMIGWAIQNSLSIKEIDTTIVTTDDKNIAKIARDHGAQTPFLRSAKLSKSSSAFTPVILDALQRVKSKFGVYDYAVILQANSPLTTPGDIRRVIFEAIKQKRDVVFSVTRLSSPPQWTLRLKGKKPEFAFRDVSQVQNYQRQQLEPLYRSSGAVYCANINYLENNPESAQLALPADGQNSAVIATDPMNAIDVDTELDYVLAEAIYTRKSKKEWVWFT